MVFILINYGVYLLCLVMLLASHLYTIHFCIMSVSMYIIMISKARNPRVIVLLHALSYHPVSLTQQCLKLNYKCKNKQCAIG